MTQWWWQEGHLAKIAPVCQRESYFRTSALSWVSRALQQGNQLCVEVFLSYLKQINLVL